MKRRSLTITSGVVAAAFLLLASEVLAKHTQKDPPVADPAFTASYDAARDPAKDLKAAIAIAAKTHRNILLEVGGDWCVYCNMMDQAFRSHPQLERVRDANFVTVKVNYSPANANTDFLSRYPKIADYPHFFVLDSKGTLLLSQPTHRFEHGKSYNVGKIEDFLKKSTAPPRHWLTAVG